MMLPKFTSKNASCILSNKKDKPCGVGLESHVGWAGITCGLG